MKEVYDRTNYFYNTYYSNEVMIRSFSNVSETLENLLDSKDKIIFKDLLDLLYISSNFSMRKEETIEESLNEYKLKINNDHIDILISKIASEYNEDKSFVIDGVHFKNAIDLINTIRNKFAHGKYQYLPDECTVNMKVNGKTIHLSLEWLKVFNKLVFLEVSKLKNDGYYYEGIIKVKADNYGHIDNYQSFKKVFTKLKYYEFIVTPKVPNMVYSNYENIYIANYISNICQKFNSFDNCDKDIRDLRKYCEEHNLNLELNIIPLSNFKEEEKKKLKDAYHKVSDFDKIDTGAQLRLIAQWIIDIKHIRNTTENNSIGYSSLHDYVYYTGAGKSYLSFCKSHPNYALFYEKSYIAMLLSKFNILYAYNAEDIYDEYLDYSKLDLSSIKYSVNKFEDYKLMVIENDIRAIEKALDISIEYLNEVKTNLENILLKAKEDEPKYEKPKKLLIDKINREKQNYDHLSNSLLELEEKKRAHLNDIESNKKYYENKNIISHIRNSLAHGNFQIDTVGKGKTIGDSIIHIKDLYNDENTFESIMTIQEFNSLFSNKNFQVICDAYRLCLSKYKNNSTLDEVIHTKK